MTFKELLVLSIPVSAGLIGLFVAFVLPKLLLRGE